MSSDLELSENVWFVWSKTSLSGILGMVTNDDEQPGEPRASLLVDQCAKQTFAIYGQTRRFLE